MKLITHFGTIEYEGAWLESRIEERLSVEGVSIPDSQRKLDLGRYPGRIAHCSYLITSGTPFNSLTYRKTLEFRDVPNEPNLRFSAEALAQLLSGTPSRMTETVILDMPPIDWVEVSHVQRTTLPHIQNSSERNYNRHRARWRGDFEAVPEFVPGGPSEMIGEGEIEGSQACDYVLGVVINEAKLYRF